MKHLRRLFLFLLLIAVPAAIEAQNNDMFKQKRERRRLWRKWRGNRERKNKTAYNPYLEKKAKDKPSARLAKGNKRELRQQKRMARRQLRKSKRKVNS